jgi:hypothetical protein
VAAQAELCGLGMIQLRRKTHTETEKRQSKEYEKGYDFAPLRFCDAGAEYEDGNQKNAEAEESKED